MSATASIAPEPALFEAYEEWRQIAETAGEAIRSGKWSVASDCHKRIAALQTRITRLTAETRQTWQRTGVGTGKEQKLRAIVASLIELELQNNSFLATAKQTARLHLDQLGRARQNLKRVHRSYSSARPTMWNSFS